MLVTKQLREEIKSCLKGVELFTTIQLKEMLEKNGYIYNRDYDVTVFSNAISSLVKQKYIASADKEKRGNYIVLDKMQNIDDQEEGKKKMGKKWDDNETELKEMRGRIKEDIKEFCVKMEQLLDSEKPSTYGRNRRTYDDILKLIDLLKEFEFEVEK